VRTFLSDLLGQLVGPARALLLNSGSEEYWLCLPTSLLLVAWAYRRYHVQRGAFSWRGFSRFVLPWRASRHRSVTIDLKMWVLNYYYGGMVLTLAYVFFPDIEPWAYRLVTNVVGGSSLPPTHASGGWLPDLLFAACLFLVSDFAFFAVHWAFHKVPLLWEFHKVHHSAERLNPITAYRGHPLNLLATTVFTTILTGVVAALFDAAYPKGVNATTVLGSDLFVLACNFAGGMLRHSPVWLHFGPHLNRFVCSPAHHQIHHSEDPRHWGKNLGGILSIFDWMAGTLYVPGERETLTYGLADPEENARYNASVGALYWLPFFRAWKGHIRPALQRWALVSCSKSGVERSAEQRVELRRRSTHLPRPSE
jgi:sterol desaturase/sphingolipid hydroxylase (fatty acid hydroxylase superfamily)